MLGDSNIWVLLAFIIFCVLVYRPASKAIIGALDGHAERIRSDLDEAARLREEAQRTLAEYQRRQRDAQREADLIVADARAEAERIRINAMRDIAERLQRREQLAMESITRAEAAALAEVRDLVVDVAVNAARNTLRDGLAGSGGAALIDAAIADLPHRLN